MAFTFQEKLSGVKANVIIKLIASWWDQLKDDDIKNLAEALGSNSSLLELIIHNCNVRDAGTQHLANALKSNTTLQKLALIENKITDAGAQHLANALKTNTTLHKLTLSNNNISDIGVQYLANALKTNTTLHKLILSKNKITDIGAQYLANVLKTNTTLKELTLGNNITDIGAQYLANALEINTSLKKLKLSDNKIGDAGAKHLANALEINTSLKKLKLSDNEIGDAGAKHLANVLKTNTTLKELYLFDNYIGYGAKRLLKALETNIYLQALYLKNFKIEFEILEKIKLKTASNKHLYDSIKYFINKLFDQYVELNGTEKINVTNDHWLEEAVYNNLTNQLKVKNLYIFKPIGKVKLLEYFIKYPNPAQFISKDISLKLKSFFTETFKMFHKDLSKSYFSKYFHFNGVCKSLKIEDDSQSVPSAPKDIDNNNLQTSNESNENVFSLVPKDVFSYIALLTYNNGGVNHSANVQNPDDSMNNAGDKSEHGE